MAIMKRKAEKPKLTLENKIVPTVEISCQKITESNRKWFFKNSLHFNYYPGCCYDECSICLDKYTEHGDTVTYYFCKHAFHTNCIENWAKTNSLCPLCKQDFRKHK